MWGGVRLGARLGTARPGRGCGANCDGGVGSACILPLLAVLPRVRLYYRRALSRGPNEGPGLRVRAEAYIVMLYCYVIDVRSLDHCHNAPGPHLDFIFRVSSLTAVFD